MTAPVGMGPPEEGKTLTKKDIVSPGKADVVGLIFKTTTGINNGGTVGDGAVGEGNVEIGSVAGGASSDGSSVTGAVGST